MLTKVNVGNPQGNTLVLPLEDYSSSGYLIKDIDGLDPVKANIVTTSVANVDGVQAQSTRREARYITFKLGLQTAAGAVRDLRKRLYDYFMPEANVYLSFDLEDGTTVYINGKVESFDCPIFVQEPEATIAILCEDPDFYLVDRGVVNGLTTEVFDDETLVEYDGTVDTGISFVITPDRDIAGFTIYHRSGNNDYLSSLEFDMALAAGERLVLSTISGSKYALLVRTDSTYEEVMYGVSPYSSWIALTPGNNHIRVHVDGASMPYLMEYRRLLGGL